MKIRAACISLAVRGWHGEVEKVIETMPLNGLRHLSLKSRDLKKTERFYTEVLGLRVAFRSPPNMTFLRWPKEDDLLGFVKTRGKVSPGCGLDHFGFKVSRTTLKEVEKKLKENEVEIEGRRGRNAIYFRDPNRHWVEVYCD